MGMCTIKNLICIASFFPILLLAEIGVVIDGEELKAITHLIEVTEKQLVNQKALKQLMITFQEQKREFLKGKEEKKIGFQMAQTAQKILSIIEAEHLRELFPITYLEELTFFSNLLKKNHHGTYP